MTEFFDNSKQLDEIIDPQLGEIEQVLTETLGE
jgi:hypothetical protein